MEQDPYDILGVSPYASLEEIRDKYRELSKFYHPDLHQGASERIRQEADRRQEAVNRAWKAIQDERARSPHGPSAS